MPRQIETIAPILAEEMKQHLTRILSHFPAPFILYSEAAIHHQCRLLNRFSELPGGYKNFAAFKANFNRSIQTITTSEGCGADCSSIPELLMAKSLKLKPEDTYFSSNNTSAEEFKMAFDMGVTFNFDDFALLKKAPRMPEIACARYNPGPLISTAGNFVGKPEESKYGMDMFQIMDFYRIMRDSGVKRNKIHTMICSNERDYRRHLATAKMTLNLISWISRTLGIPFEEINCGGGYGVAYNPATDNHLDLEALFSGLKVLLEDFHREHGWAPRYVTENGRFLSASAGVLVAKVINIKQNVYRKVIGLNASTYSSVPRPLLYNAFHEVSFLRQNPVEGTETCDVAGSLCENADKFAIDREVPIVKENDHAFVHCAGAHCMAMTGEYNSRTKVGELMIYEDESIGCIREPRKNEQLFDELIAPENVVRISL